jgi:hypothetical protein
MRASLPDNCRDGTNGGGATLRASVIVCDVSRISKLKAGRRKLCDFPFSCLVEKRADSSGRDIEPPADESICLWEAHYILSLIDKSTFASSLNPSTENELISGERLHKRLHKRHAPR